MTKASAGPRIDELERRRDALLILDVDEVVLEFIAPFQKILSDHGAHLHADSFKLTGNVRSMSTGTALTGNELDQITLRLYEEQETRQPVVEGAHAALRALNQDIDILFLTAMQPSYYDHRRRLLDREGFTYPMIATERSKGAVVSDLSERWDGPIVFVDDLPPNLQSVRLSCPSAHLVHLMANDVFRPHLPPLPPGATPARDWSEAERIIRRVISA
ncbi:hypothetical protein SAMN06297251_103187 [Fulvimarina manganoxydans]|uniref:Uncharacterized protein n=1 Tax=Fulvimarina manganoxydans TaxID=937218 RepID=A0A1W1ZX76_9HYPH|nr:hypothetical protein [Fulvimarina manganoxydans]SMC53004.1 hypothetical protein SAMN06297251_103187 [Fulvimarina manganoxydans]